MDAMSRRSALVALAMLAIGVPSIEAQTSTIIGVVRDTDGVPVVGAVIHAAAGSDTVETASADDGRFALDLRLPVHLMVTHVGYDGAAVDVPVGQAGPVLVTLRPRPVELEAVDVRAARTADIVRERTMAVSAVDATDVRVQTLTTSDAIDRVAGVRVRQEGGIGSASNISIHGLSGQQIRQFIDGVPVEFMGAAGSSSGVALTMLDRIEVYKGVVPVELGADALGGAINLITTRGAGRTLDATFAAGSFGTWRAGAAGRWSSREDREFAGFSVSHAQSQNDYEVDVTLPDEFNQPRPFRAQRFHDAYRNSRATVELGLRGRRWADEIALHAFGADEADEVQHNAIMTQPYGHVESGAGTAGARLHWRKAIRDGRVTLSLDGGVARTTGTLTDTSQSVYGWDGSVLRHRDYGAEISTSKNLLDIVTWTDFARLNAAVAAGSGFIRLHALRLGASRRGRDPLATEHYGFDPYASRSSLEKTVIGAAWEADWSGGRLRTTLGLKGYHYHATGWSIQNLEYQPAEPQSRMRAGALAAAAFHATPDLLVKASWEYATRLPDSREMLGDFILIRPNPALRPEVSHNFNLSIDGGTGGLEAGVGFFYRLTDDIVYLQTSQFFAQYRNLLEARSLGLEATASWRPATPLQLAAALTWQDIRNRSPRGASAEVADRYHGARLPNVPYLFGNAQLTFEPESLIGAGSRTTLWWTTQWVREFFLHWEVDGRRDSKAIIPEQLLHGLGAAWQAHHGRLQLIGEVRNLFNARAFDVFSVQRPGRSFQLQARVLLAGSPAS